MNKTNKMNKADLYCIMCLKLREDLDLVHKLDAKAYSYCIKYDFKKEINNFFKNYHHLIRKYTEKKHPL